MTDEDRIKDLVAKLEEAKQAMTREQEIARQHALREFERGVAEGRATQAILEIKGRELFLKGLRKRKRKKK